MKRNKKPAAQARWEYRVAGPEGFGPWQIIDNKHRNWWVGMRNACPDMVEVREVSLANLTKSRFIAVLAEVGWVDMDDVKNDRTSVNDDLRFMCAALGITEE